MLESLENHTHQTVLAAMMAKKDEIGTVCLLLSYIILLFIITNIMIKMLTCKISENGV